MALLDKIKSVFAQPQTEEGGKIYIVDACNLEQAADKKQLSPHQQIQILKRLSGFAKKEGITIHALIDGKPLRVVADGGDFSGVKVFFTKNKMDIEALIRKRLKAIKGSATTVITSNHKLESELESEGAQLMSASTFKKAIGMDGGKGRSRGSKRKSNKPSSNKKRRKKSNSGGASKKPKNKDDHVSELIDLVD